MKFDYKKDISPKYLLLVLSILSILLIIISAVSPNTLKGVRSTAIELISPMQKGVNKAGGWVSDQFQVFGDVKELKKENAELRKEINDYKNELDKNEAELSELQELRDLYALDQMYPEYKKTAARVVSVDTTGWFNEFYINKGLNQGVYEDCNVICDDGLLGIVTESYDNYAKVRAIIDDRSSITAQIGNNGTLCTVEGSLQTMDDGYLMATDIDKNSVVSEGDKVITANVSDRYLYGLTVGYVISVKDDPNNLTQTAKIKPTVGFTDVKDVFVILDRKQEVNY